MTETAARQRVAVDHPHYKWVALSNTTLGILIATVNSSIVIISLPAIFKGIHVDPLGAGNVSYLLWMIMGFLVVSAVLVVVLGRLGDMFGRVKIYNLGFVVFAIASIFLSLDPLTGGQGALWLIAGRVIQGVGGAMLFANSTAILTDAFPAHERGMALGINNVAAVAGSFIGLVLGGVLSEWDWRAVFWVSVPIGIVGTIWSYMSLHETGVRRKGGLDLPGNLTFAVGLTALLVAITYGIQPYGDSAMGWGNPWVIAGIVGGVVLLVIFCVIETRVASPMFEMSLFRIRPFWAGNLAGLLSSVSRGGMQFMLIIWLQGIWLPRHGYSYESTPLWAGIYLLPLTVGFLVAGPLSGRLSDRYGARLFAAVGMVLVALTFIGFLLIPVDFPYWLFALILLINGLASGLFAAPNVSSIMNAVPANRRGAASGMRGTFFNSGSSLSIGVFFSLMIAGLANTLPDAMRTGLTAHGVSTQAAQAAAEIPPVGSLFASFLGFNPIGTILDQIKGAGIDLGSPDKVLTGKEFFPQLMSDPFHHGLVVVFGAAAVMSLLAGVASLFAGGKYVHEDASEGGGVPSLLEHGGRASDQRPEGPSEPVLAETASGLALPEDE
ncbi:MFS transporter [Nocardioides sp. Kera G14]|uniref:MFS transporter n=1 Tax=Nocardioides sp. Kera G14 TaxID=2884264 RepID=UPI001D1211DB|nr:MFS transporter [Nocardioides sp. Kera G14]UDY25092.1 MFS transporter [Nocardioides sp. Kera G14]